jgi:predicted nuclease with TOPRIM domain
MDPNATNPNNVQPADDTPPVQPPVAETPAPEVSPVAPEVPATPQNIAAPVQTPQAPKPSDKKKIILIAAIVGGVVLLVGIAFVVYSLLFSVSKKDYQEAKRQYNDVSIASAGLTSDVASVSYTLNDEDDADFNDAAKEAEASIEKIKTENTELSKMKAVRVGEGAKLYKAFNDKVDAYLAYATGLIDSVKNLRPAMTTCNKVSDAKDANSRVAALKACSSELQGVTDIPNAEMKAFIGTLASAYGDYATVYEQISALSNPYGSQYEQYKTLRDKMYDVQDKISDASSILSDELDKRDDELSIKDSAKALGDFLTEKQKS